MDKQHIMLIGLVQGGQRIMTGVVAATLMMAQLTLPPQVEAGPLGSSSPATLQFFHGDHLGSTNLVTDAYGAVVETRQYTTLSPAPGAPSQLTYDANGNLSTQSIVNSPQSIVYTYDSENRLLRATGPFGTASYTYDPFGRRL